MFLTAAVTLTRMHSVCGTDPSWMCRHILNATGSDFAASAVSWVVGAPLRILFILVIALIANRALRRMVRKTLHRLTLGGVREGLGALRLGGLTGAQSQDAGHLRAEQRTDALAGVLRSVITCVIVVLAGFMVLGQLGINLAPLIAGAGIAGVALGLGAQSLVKDFLSGMFILIEDQFGVGDIVDLGEASGTVEAISLRTTRLRSIDGIVWHVPNGEIVRVGNKSQHWSRALLDIGVAYDTDIAFAKQVIKETLDDIWQSDEAILEEPTVLGVEELGDSAVTIRCWLKTQPSEQYRVSRTTRERMKQALDAAGIEMPFPQQTVWHRPDPAFAGSGNGSDGGSGSGAR